ncbi:hypothetical protein QQ045_029246 [Rhodiola kirilowii]
MIELKGLVKRTFMFHYQRIWEDHLGLRSTVEGALTGVLSSNAQLNFGLKLKKSAKEGWNVDIEREVVEARSALKEALR